MAQNFRLARQPDKVKASVRRTRRRAWGAMGCSFLTRFGALAPIRRARHEANYSKESVLFAKAIELVAPFTHPVIVSRRSPAGIVECGCATFMVLNAQGHFLTAAHVLDWLLAAQASKQRTSLSYWWGADRVNASRITYDRLLDLAVGTLEPFDAKAHSVFPTFRNPADVLRPGTSLCRLGFPFHEIKAQYEPSTDSFHLPPGTLPVPRFPLDGMYTRQAILEEQSSGRRVEFVELSTPGLRGQSGGPIFDTEGRVCGIQSRTHHMHLGFSPVVRQGDVEQLQPQFLNVGLGPHVKEVLAFLSASDVKVEIR